MKNTSENNPICEGKRFGHNFPRPGSNCARCGINQAALSGGIKKIFAAGKKAEQRLAQPENRRLHSEIHYLVDETRKDFGETAKKGKGSFGFYLGFFQRLGTGKIHELRSQVKQSTASSPTEQRKLFWWLLKERLKK